MVRVGAMGCTFPWQVSRADTNQTLENDERGLEVLES
jgi:hypothetical protein